MSIRTPFTERFGLEHPVMLAPMAGVADAGLAVAVSSHGGLGMIGGGYGDRDWLMRQLPRSDGQRVGCGFITWSLARQPELLDLALEREPVAIMLSFGDPAPFAARIKDAGVPLVCQVQSLQHAQQAVTAGADVIVAQGTEAGGHGALRSTFTLTPAVVDLARKHSPHTLVLAAGGVADGRGLAAALVLGADGVLVGTRFYTTEESPVGAALKERVVRSDGDHTVRTSVFDHVRGYRWPAGFTARAVRNTFTDQWHGKEAELAKAGVAQADLYRRAVADTDPEIVAAFAGENVDLIHEVRSVADVLTEMSDTAQSLIAQRSGRFSVGDPE